MHITALSNFVLSLDLPLKFADGQILLMLLCFRHLSVGNRKPVYRKPSYRQEENLRNYHQSEWFKQKFMSGSQQTFSFCKKCSAWTGGLCSALRYAFLRKCSIRQKSLSLLSFPVLHSPLPVTKVRRAEHASGVWLGDRIPWTRGGGVTETGKNRHGRK